MLKSIIWFHIHVNHNPHSLKEDRWVLTILFSNYDGLKLAWIHLPFFLFSPKADTPM